MTPGRAAAAPCWWGQSRRPRASSPAAASTRPNEAARIAATFRYVRCAEGAVVHRRRGERVKSTLSRSFLSGRARHRHGAEAISLTKRNDRPNRDIRARSWLPWTAPSPYRRREIIQGASDATTGARPMRANARAILIEALWYSVGNRRSEWQDSHRRQNAVDDLPEIVPHLM